MYHLVFADENTWVKNGDLKNHTIYFERYRFFPELKEYKTIYTKAVWNEKSYKYVDEILDNFEKNRYIIWK